MKPGRPAVTRTPMSTGSGTWIFITALCACSAPPANGFIPLCSGSWMTTRACAANGQWYLAEGAQDLCHGLSQAFQKRQLPRSILMDNGSAMIAAETQQGLAGL